MQTTNYAYRVELSIDYSKAVERATAALKEEGFGVFSTVERHSSNQNDLDAVATSPSRQ